MADDEPFVWGLTPSSPTPPKKAAEEPDADETAPEAEEVGAKDVVDDESVDDDATQAFTPFFEQPTGGAPMVDAGVNMVDNDESTSALAAFFEEPLTEQPGDEDAIAAAAAAAALLAAAPVKGFTPISMPATPPAGESFPTVALSAPGTSELDALFGEGRFQDDADATMAITQASGTSEESGEAAHHTESRPPRTLLLVAASVLAVLALVALFLVGTRIPGWTSAGAEATPSPSATPTPTPTPVAVVGPHALGEAEWDQLGGGECLDPFVSPWELSFVVVDCAAPHAAQLTFRGTFPDGDYPGDESLLAQTSQACAAPTAIDLAAGAAFPDLQVSVSYPGSDTAWDDGDRHFYCFMTRVSGQPITGSLAPVV